MNNKIVNNKFDLGELVKEDKSPDIYVVMSLRKVPGFPISYSVLNLEKRTESRRFVESDLVAFR